LLTVGFAQVVCVVNITTLTNRQYCVIVDPVDDKGKPQMGRRKLVKGECSFFLMPGESLEKGIQNIYVLGEDEGLILRATESFKDGVCLTVSRSSFAEVLILGNQIPTWRSLDDPWSY
jgi:major vault protein